MFRHAVELNWVCRVGNRGWCLLRSEPALSNTDYPRIDPGHQRKPGRGCSQGGPPSSRADQSGAARTDLTTRHCSCDQPFPPDLEPPVRSQSFELLPSPPRQVGVDAAQERVHLKPVEFAIIVHPPANERVDPLSECFQVCRGFPVHPPSTDLPTLVLQRHRANRRLERREYSAVPARLRLPGTEHIPQERERRVGKLGPPITVLAVSGSPGESHPQAPTERSVTVSRHSALTTQSAGTGESMPSARTARGRVARPLATTPSDA